MKLVKTNQTKKINKRNNTTNKSKTKTKHEI